ncbi:PAS domain-containing sensor histidine kinase [Exilibacterium tricleocarpae]|uniref:histidine kinase n=1 Tax=Exilibacterium tricleocarpae TaxID=2591008 RepID=A0A545T851_9GAMM|nr:PAS domain-containing sensor histidine kinase [Exilibacterium tricleocarpae]TQV73391.1 PAS domain-containing sensor histidine kinase [Exilibacterium tricleocarpae]
MMADSHPLAREFYDRLRADDQLLEWIEQGASTGIWYRDLERHDHQWLSPRLQLIFGLDDGETPSPPQLPQESRSAQEAEHSGDHPDQPGDRLLRCRHRNGKTIWVRHRQLTIRNADGTPIRSIGVYTDVTAEKLHELELERSNQELSTFAYVASHDLKSPLRAIKQLAAWIEEDLDSVSDSVAENLALMKNRILRMETLLQDLLAYSRIGRLERRTEVVDTLASIKGIFALLDVPPDFRMVTEGDFPCLTTLKAPFEQVMRNLIDNAVKHRKSAAGTVTLSVRENDDFFEFRVTDDGPGIPERFQEKVFEIFQTLQPRDRVEGSGMGLAIVKKIVETHGGSIKLEPVAAAEPAHPDSAGSSGTSFVFTWPKAVVG